MAKTIFISHRLMISHERFIPADVVISKECSPNVAQLEFGLYDELILCDPLLGAGQTSGKEITKACDIRKFFPL